MTQSGREVGEQVVSYCVDFDVCLLGRGKVVMRFELLYLAIPKVLVFDRVMARQPFNQGTGNHHVHELKRIKGFRSCGTVPQTP